MNINTEFRYKNCSDLFTCFTYTGKVVWFSDCSKESRETAASLQAYD